MRILGVAEKWPKLKKPLWTTFRLCRRDRDWQVGEVVQVVYRPRSKQREVLGVARILEKTPKHIITKDEATEDGFENTQEMRAWILKTHGDRIKTEPLNKLTLAWQER